MIDIPSAYPIFPLDPLLSKNWLGGQGREEWWHEKNMVNVSDRGGGVRGGVGFD